MKIIQKGYIAIDDIHVHKGNCQPINLCTFEDGDSNNLCGYTNDPGTDMKWFKIAGERLGPDVVDVIVYFLF